MKMIAYVMLLVGLTAQIVQASPVSVATVPVKFDFRLINVGQVVQLVYGEALKQPYVIHPDVLADARLVSFRYESANGDSRSFLANFLDTLGFAIETKQGVDYITRKLPEDKKELPPADMETFVYKPKHREVGYISRVLAPVFQGSFAVNRTIAAPDSAKVNRPVPEGSVAAMVDQNADVLIFTGTVKEIATLQRLLPQIDDAKGQVMVRGVVYEVASSDKEGSAFALALSILGGKFSIVNGGSATLDSAIRLKTSSIDAVFSALSSDSRFNVISKASVRVASGDTGRFNSGQEVPVLGAISYPTGAGQAVQDVQYRNSGVTFEVKPNVRDQVVDLKVRQQISDFVSTTTGVNNSPTLNKREVETSLSLQDGDVVVLGGLSQDKQTGSHSGLSFLPAFLHSKGSENTKSEILLVLQLQKL
ncbi:type II secretion system protein GspD [Undibacterium sp. Tian12W]|uniref:type II secretion system protein GspD n=1 Tax=Undibacterium sp. Tian12W TaxID=3413054 RepID=UPI003BF057B8